MIPTYVVIPYKDKPEFTVPLVEELKRQAEFEEIYLLDNGSSSPTRRQIEVLVSTGVFVYPTDGMNIHQMWNYGMHLAARSSRGRPHNVLILNNDLSIGPGFVKILAGVLRAEDGIAVACPNYDKRPGNGYDFVEDRRMHTGHYDHTEGMCGFAFILRGEDGHRFPEELHWWYGDNDLLLTVKSNGQRVAFAYDTACEHKNSGTLRVQEEPFKSLVESDYRLHVDKWGAAC